ncbi:hypothetical protein B9479_005393 [Cryptococcus floricola]|uniref:Kinetochore protein Mis13/DSN1 n=1 Tax=Cryptococcus floricola TaxID=2591691 RepID=A0A5D3AR66_9TREE|nr:hypothetical protein B9479_005393 [Cryptococcus floricola]
MASRRSTRLSNELDTGGKAVNGKRKSTAGGRDDEGDAAQPKKKKQGSKKGFQPQPVSLPDSSNTPPEEEIPLNLPPPPPSTKPARRRDAARRPASESPPPHMTLEPGPNPAKKQKVGDKNSERSRGKSVEQSSRDVRGTEDDPLAGVEETASMRQSGKAPAVPHLSFKRDKPRFSEAPPASPPRRTFSSNSSRAGSSKTPAPTKSAMGPPVGFVRKTRKSIVPQARTSEVLTHYAAPLVESETPVINRNKEYRQETGRRGSKDRGGRASTSFGRGDITMPHKSIDYRMLYRHLPSGLPDPHRARILITWNANQATREALRHKSSSSKGKEKETDTRRTDGGDSFIKDIMDEFHHKMSKGAVETNTFSSIGDETEPFSISGLRPHPRNVANRRTEAEIVSVVRRFKEEGAHWSAIATAANSRQQDTIRRLEKKMMANADPDMSKAPTWMQQILAVTEEIIAQPDLDPSLPLASSSAEAQAEASDNASKFEEVEFKVDMIHQTSHVALQYVMQSSRFLDGIFSSLTADLRARERLGLAPALPPPDEDGPDTVALLAAARQSAAASTTSAPKKPRLDAMSLLRSLATAEAKSQSEETVAAAAKVAPMPAMSSMTPRRPGTGVVAGMTPRRTGGLKSVMTPRGMKGYTPRGDKE